MCADISLQHEAKEMRIIKTNRVTNFWHNSGIDTLQFIVNCCHIMTQTE
jgi:hypothetical protein